MKENTNKSAGNLLIAISSYSSDEEKKKIEEIFSSFNITVNKNYFTESVEQQLLQIIVDLSQIDIKDIIIGGLVYDLLKTSMINLFNEVKTKKPVLKLKYKNKVIFYNSDNNSYWMSVNDKTKANYKDQFYQNESLKEMLKLTETELQEEEKNV